MLLIVPAVIFVVFAFPIAFGRTEGITPAANFIFFVLAPVWAALFAAVAIGSFRNRHISRLYRLVAVVANGAAFAATLPGIFVWAGMFLCSTVLRCEM